MSLSPGWISIRSGKERGQPKVPSNTTSQHHPTSSVHIMCHPKNLDCFMKHLVQGGGARKCFKSTPGSELSSQLKPEKSTANREKDSARTCHYSYLNWSDTLSINLILKFKTWYNLTNPKLATTNKRYSMKHSHFLKFNFNPRKYLQIITGNIPQISIFYQSHLVATS